MKKSARKRKRIGQELLLWWVRPVLHKLQDLEFGKKVDRVFDKDWHGEPAIVKCMDDFRSYIDCTIAPNGDAELLLRKNRLLARTDAFRAQLSARTGHAVRRTVPAKYGRELMDAYLEFLNLVHEKPKSLGNCQSHWVSLSKVVDAVWPEGMVLQR